MTSGGIALLQLMPIAPGLGRDVTRVVRRCNDAKTEKELDLSECRLFQVPDAIFLLLKNTTITSCDLSSNSIRRIPSKLSIKFAALTSLNLSSNQMTTLPEEVSELSSLKTLDISKNCFPSIPNSVLSLQSLQNLNVESNIIVEIDVEQILTMQSLTDINLKDNPLNLSTYCDLKNIDNISVELSEQNDDYADVD